MLNRRDLLRNTGVAIAIFTGLAPGISKAAKAALRVRRNIAGMTLNDPDLAAWRDFVSVMRARPQTLVNSWAGFANIHGDLHRFNACQHGNWYFLPWHRAFIEMYERAVADITGHKNFAMPYWDWTSQRRLPAAFRTVRHRGKPNPLYSPGPAEDQNMQRARRPRITDDVVGPKVMGSILNSKSPTEFGGSAPIDFSVTPPLVQDSLDPAWLTRAGHASTFEAVPHNGIHDAVGGFMGNTPAARDPLFMLHHSNIDRVWEAWLKRGGRHYGNRLWRNMTFPDHFARQNGERYSRSVAQLLSASDLGYRYQDLSVSGLTASALTPAAPERQARLDQLLDPGSRTQGRTLQRIERFSSNGVLQSAPLRVIAPDGGPRSPTMNQGDVMLVLRGIHGGAHVDGVRIFLNLPDADQHTAETDPHFVAHISLFGSAAGAVAGPGHDPRPTLKHDAPAGHGGHGSSGYSVMLDITPTVRGLQALGLLRGDEVTVSLVPSAANDVPLSAVGEVYLETLSIGVL